MQSLGYGIYITLNIVHILRLHMYTHTHARIQSDGCSTHLVASTFLT